MTGLTFTLCCVLSIISQTYKAILSKRVEDSVQKDTDKVNESIKWHFIKHPEA